MGSWGPAIFSDDTASDIRGEYRELLEDQVPDDEATTRIIEAFRDLAADEEHVLWLALAAAQSQWGRLDERVRSEALAVIDSGRGLELWEEAGPKELARRKAVLAKLREQITGPQPSRKTLRRPWRHVTDLNPGDVLACQTESGALALFRVARIDDDRVGAAPIVEWLDWDRSSLPSERKLRRLKVRVGAAGALDRPPRSRTFRVARHRRKDEDWADAGFELVSNAGTRKGDDQVQAWTYLQWRALRSEVDRELSTQSTPNV
ncbi:hypothetical protein [Nocardioides sp. SYSU D00038]|uniref:hypothetical protein n=1 Tax=Nocardioides sp. SYSU D00038 TaxID=2812554 RepID=UPI0019674F02|nr:hypothetical protein [Nocardioides sp. SYSU D00038]